MVKSTDAGISSRTQLYASGQMLEHAMPVMVLEKFADTKPMPKNKTTTIKFRRPVTFTAATTPLQEGVTPDPTPFSYEDVMVSIKQYGQVVEVTDVIEDTHEDPVLNDASTQAGENIGRTMEALDYGILKAGTNVIYTNGTVRSQVNTTLTIGKQRAATRALKRQKGLKISKILASHINYKTSPIEAAYVGIGHTDLENEIRGLPGFIPVAQYGQRKPICEEEIGSVEDVRYILSADLDSFPDAGGAAGNMVSTNGTNADVYPILYISKHAYGKVALRGQGSVSPTIIPVGQKTKDDPLGQRGYVGWKTWHAALILNQLWMVRVETCSTEL